MSKSGQEYEINEVKGWRYRRKNACDESTDCNIVVSLFPKAEVRASQFGENERCVSIERCSDRFYLGQGCNIGVRGAGPRAIGGSGDPPYELDVG